MNNKRENSFLNGYADFIERNKSNLKNFRLPY